MDYAGDYIQDFRRDQLKFTALKGEIFLQDLELRTDALLEVTSHLPLTVVGCRVDQLKIKIPWKKLKKEHVSVTCRGIYVVIAPQNLAEHGAPGETWSEVMRRQQVVIAYMTECDVAYMYITRYMTSVECFILVSMYMTGYVCHICNMTSCIT